MIMSSWLIPFYSHNLKSTCWVQNPPDLFTFYNNLNVTKSGPLPGRIRLLRFKLWSNGQVSLIEALCLTPCWDNGSSYRHLFHFKHMDRDRPAAFPSTKLKVHCPSVSVHVCRMIVLIFIRRSHPLQSFLRWIFSFWQANDGVQFYVCLRRAFAE